MAYVLRRPRAVQLPPAAPRWVAGVAAVLTFPLAIHVLQTGAGEIAEPLRARLVGATAESMLGAGWLASMVALSGSPVAAAALALFQRGALDELQCFTMIVGTRFGAIFVALALAALYASRPRATHSRIPPVEVISHGGASSLAIGLLACLTTEVVGWLSLGLGLLLLPRRFFAFALPRSLLHGISKAADPLVKPLSDHLPGFVVFALGVGLVLVAFKLIDLALPVGTSEQAPRWIQRHLANRLSMFLAGLVVTLVTPSVTVSVGLLVPLHAKGYVRGARLVPYVLGANIAAFSDTLLASLVLGDPRATNVVVTEIVSILVASVGILAIGHDSLERALVWAAERIAADSRLLWGFLAVSAATPAILLLV